MVAGVPTVQASRDGRRLRRGREAAPLLPAHYCRWTRILCAPPIPLAGQYRLMATRLVEEIGERRAARHLVPHQYCQGEERTGQVHIVVTIDRMSTLCKIARQVHHLRWSSLIASSATLALNSAENRLRVFMLDRPSHRAIHLMPCLRNRAPPQPSLREGSCSNNWIPTRQLLAKPNSEWVQVLEWMSVLRSNA